MRDCLRCQSRTYTALLLVVRFAPSLHLPVSLSCSPFLSSFLGLGLPLRPSATQQHPCQSFPLPEHNPEQGTSSSEGSSNSTSQVRCFYSFRFLFHFPMDDMKVVGKVTCVNLFFGSFFSSLLLSCQVIFLYLTGFFFSLAQKNIVSFKLLYVLYSMQLHYSDMNSFL